MEKSKRSKKKKQQEVAPLERITVGETLRVNIGDYEHRDSFVSYGANVRKGETPDDAHDRAQKFVLGKLRKREKKIRSSSKEWVDFDTKAKEM